MNRKFNKGDRVEVDSSVLYPGRGSKQWVRGKIAHCSGGVYWVVCDDDDKWFSPMYIAEKFLRDPQSENV